MNRFILALCLLFAGCVPPPPPARFAAGDTVEVKVDHRKGVIIDVWDAYKPSYRVRLHSHIIGYRVIIMHENELSKAKP